MLIYYSLFHWVRLITFKKMDNSVQNSFKNTSEVSQSDECVRQIIEKEKIKIKWQFAFIFCIFSLLTIALALWLSALPPKKVVKNDEIELVHVWIGGAMPEKYMKKIAASGRKIRLLTNEDWESYGKDWLKYESLLTVQKSDILRLLYLYENGGFYHDFDVTCNYNYLYQNLPEEKGCYLGSYKSGFKSNSFLYCNEKKNEDFKRLIGEVRERILGQQNGKLKFNNIDEKVLQTTGPNFLNTLDYLKPFPFYKRACLHSAKGIWIQTESLKPKNSK